MTINMCICVQEAAPLQTNNSVIISRKLLIIYSVSRDTSMKYRITSISIFCAETCFICSGFHANAASLYSSCHAVRNKLGHHKFTMAQVKHSWMIFNWRPCTIVLLHRMWNIHARYHGKVLLLLLFANTWLLGIGKVSKIYHVYGSYCNLIDLIYNELFSKWLIISICVKIPPKYKALYF